MRAWHLVSVNDDQDDDADEEGENVDCGEWRCSADESALNSLISATSPLSPGHHQFQSGPSTCSSLSGHPLSLLLETLHTSNRLSNASRWARRTFDLSTLCHVHKFPISCSFSEFPERWWILIIPRPPTLRDDGIVLSGAHYHSTKHVIWRTT